jgi:protein-S-isoprenylcysteine O-methyltransferase Ste14
MDLDTTATVVGTAVAAISIVIVYHLFALQMWTERGHALLDESIQLSLTTAPGDVRRQDLTQRAAAWLKQYPWPQVVVLGVAVLGMCALGFFASAHVTGLSARAVIDGPLLVLVFVYAMATALIRRQGRGVYEQARRYVG